MTEDSNVVSLFWFKYKRHYEDVPPPPPALTKEQKIQLALDKQRVRNDEDAKKDSGSRSKMAHQLRP